MVNLTQAQCNLLIDLLSEERNALRAQMQDDPGSVEQGDLDQIDEVAHLLRESSAASQTKVPFDIKSAVLFTISNYEQLDVVDLVKELMDDMTPEQLTAVSDTVHRQPMPDIVIEVDGECVALNHVILRSLVGLDDAELVLRHLRLRGTSTNAKPHFEWTGDVDQFKQDCEVLLY